MMMRGIERTFNVDGSPYIGIFAACTESLLLLPHNVPGSLAVELGRTLQTKVIRTLIAETSLAGCLAVGNTKGLIVSQYTLDSEIERVKESAQAVGLEVTINRLPARDRISAAGNVILANDTVALVHPGLSQDALDVVKATLGVRVYKGTIGGLKTVGMAAVATNRGILAHKNATREELEFLEEIYELPVEIGSVNFGVPVIGAALLANTKGYAAGDETTGAELGRIEEALGF
ncbi:MAG: translation initiation factor IF-6 [Halobacteriota archaeon]